jgi:hypothetical protein
MTSRRLSNVFQFVVMVLTSGFLCPAVIAQAGPLPDAPMPFVQPVSPVSVGPLSAYSEHKFWDKTNTVLFVTAAGLSVADFAVTRANLQNGGIELNPVVRFFGTSTPRLAVNFAAENVGLIGFSYFLHRTGHHKVERAISVVNIGGSAFAVSYGLTHR